MTSDTRTSDGVDDRKAVLFCPVCEHEGPVDGAWSLDAREAADYDRTDVTCPECGHVVVSQPRFSTPGDRRPSVTLTAPVLQLLDAVVRHDVL